MDNLENTYPINTFKGETKWEIIDLIKKREREAREKERQRLLDIFTYEDEGRVYVGLRGDTDITDLLKIKTNE